ncbi:hypothetical protein [Lysinibacillus piscis]|uniref:Cyclic lactone autoinducer peptide n=1 Tax=Lysinibacillus piscis TaxID=2518931 RepID=A0ABQ5NHG7_9BACI|nr:hypothetical protein [Lysinibacillus sp. KH24]GLC87469.1 hypothetical protein LYSBPC_05960 [Lysinibacillus sp. KH24]
MKKVISIVLTVLCLAAFTVSPIATPTADAAIKCHKPCLERT